MSALLAAVAPVDDDRLGRGVGVSCRRRRTTVRVCAAAILIPIVAAPGAKASIGTFQAEGVPIPAWFTEVTTKLGCTLPDDPNDSPYTKFVSCGQDWTGAGCRALMSVYPGGNPLSGRSSGGSPGGYVYAEFKCIAAPPGASPPAQCADRKATFTPGNDSWQLASDTGWVVTDVNVANCVYKHVPITFHIKRVRTDKRGGAKLTIHVPGTGRLDLTGNGIKHAKATPQKAGTVTMPVAATGSKRQKLDRTGSVKVKARIKFQPYFGDGQPSSQVRKIKLHK